MWYRSALEARGNMMIICLFFVDPDVLFACGSSAQLECLIPKDRRSGAVCDDPEAAYSECQILYGDCDPSYLARFGIQRPRTHWWVSQRSITDLYEYEYERRVRIYAPIAFQVGPNASCPQTIYVLYIMVHLKASGFKAFMYFAIIIRMNESPSLRVRALLC